MMSGVQFNCEYHRQSGEPLTRFKVFSVQAGICGAYDAKGVPWKPSLDAIAASLPYRLRIAVRRSAVWKTTFHKGGVECFHIPLTGSKGQSLGSVYAFPDRKGGNG
jgi:hypothetical protein